MKIKKLEPDFFPAQPKPEKTHSRVRLCVLAVLLAAAAFLAFWPKGIGDGANHGKHAAASPAPAATPVPTLPPESLTARQTREAAYEKDLAKLEQLSGDESLQEETRQQAARQMTRMIQQHQLELGLEEALINAGFAPCLVLMQNDALTVAVSASEVTAAQSAVILSICLAHTEVAAENIRIMPGGVQGLPQSS